MCSQHEKIKYIKLIIFTEVSVHFLSIVYVISAGLSARNPPVPH